MGVPQLDLAEKYSGKAVIEPSTVIAERRKAKLLPSHPLPGSAVICYDASLWEWVGGLPVRTRCDGWLTGALVLSHRNVPVLAMKAAGWGAPTAVMSLEELIASGVHNFVSLGAAGALQETTEFGDIVLCERAIRDEGTSHHYVPAARYAEPCPALTAALSAAMQARGIPFRRGTSWTTDAPYRETVTELRRYRAEGVMTVEMEAAALFAVGAYRGVRVASVFAASDRLAEDGWHQGYHGEEKRAGLKRVFEAALECLAAMDDRADGPH